MSIGQLIITAFVIGLSGAMAPGSLLVVIVTETVRKGFWAGPVALLGHAVTEMTMVALLALGLGKILSYQSALGVIGLAGGLMLFWFGWGTWKTARSATLALDAGAATAGAIIDARDAVTSAATGREPGPKIPARHDKGMVGTAVAGMVASVSNPYWVLWWASIGAAYVASGMKYGPIGPVTFFVGHIAADTAWYVLVSLAVATGARFLNDKVYRGVLYVCGAFLFLFGVYFLRLGWTFAIAR